LIKALIMNYLFDTNVLLKYLRDDTFKDKLEAEFDLSNPENRNLISIVTVGELMSLSLRNKWGARRIRKLNFIIKKFIIVDIRYMTLVNKYAEIDAFSQGKLKDKSLNTSSRNMGKNDLWIAATASLINARLITYDKDFDHLDKVFVDVILMTD